MKLILSDLFYVLAFVTICFLIGFVGQPVATQLWTLLCEKYAPLHYLIP
jgi:hypothetical protein